ncbi:MAG: GH36-type glycosyl hydrolase domain-containing protein, partial [Burkholderiales bacterium]
DFAITESGDDHEMMIANGGSVLNSAFASWVLGVFAGLASKLGEAALASEARAQAKDLRLLVAKAWNGRWFHRAYAPGAAPVGDADCWLEVQPWAILCGAAGDARARALLDTIKNGHSADSPLGARVRWPSAKKSIGSGMPRGEGTADGIWYAINMTLIWAAARVSPEMAWDAWRRMGLAAHTSAYPEIWEGTLSGPDAWNAPESRRPGRTWAIPPGEAPPGVPAAGAAAQVYPVNNMHSHAQPLLAFLRLLGVEPTVRGTLAVGKGGRFDSRVFSLGRDGHGRMAAQGKVVLETAHKTVRGGPGKVKW